MLLLHINDESSNLKSVIVGIANSNGPQPSPEDCYDPKSLRHVLAGTYPIEKDMIAELAEFVAVLEDYQVKVYRPEVIENYNQIFSRDIGFVIDDTFVKSNILPDRAGELNAINYLISQIHPSKVIELPQECHVEGGDVVVYNDYLFIGTYYGSDYSEYITARTNKAAITALSKLFPSKTVMPLELKKSNTDPKSNALHLDCCFQPLGQGKAIMHPGGFLHQEDVEWIRAFFGRDNIFEIDAFEMTQMHSNIFSISNEVVVIEKRFVRLNAWLVDNGFTTEAINFSEISKQGGLLRCATLPLERT